MKFRRVFLPCVLTSLCLLSGGAFAQVVTELSAGISTGAQPLLIAVGSDGNLWFTEFDGGRIGRITPLGVVTEFSTGITAGATPFGITAGPDGNVWFAESNFDQIARITPLGAVTQFSTGISAGANPRGITPAPMATSGSRNLVLAR